MRRARWQYNLLIVFLVSGLWHGANWTYVIWGGLHGFYIISSIWTEKMRSRLSDFAGMRRLPVLHKCLQIVITFSLVSFAWIFFRAGSVHDAFYIVTSIAGSVGGLLRGHVMPEIRATADTLKNTGLRNYQLMIPVAAIALMEFVHLTQRRGSVRQMVSERPAVVRWPLYYALVFGIIVFGMFDNSRFIYFQF